MYKSMESVKKSSSILLQSLVLTIFYDNGGSKKNFQGDHGNILKF